MRYTYGLLGMLALALALALDSRPEAFLAMICFAMSLWSTWERQ